LSPPRKGPAGGKVGGHLVRETPRVTGTEVFGGKWVEKGWVNERDPEMRSKPGKP